MVYSELYRVLWRNRWLVIGGTLLCLALALAATLAQEKRYTSTATVRVEPAGDSNANDRFEASQRLSRSYAEIYTQGSLIDEMNRLLGSQRGVSKDELAAKQVKDLDLLAVSGVSTDPRRAVLVASAGARALESFSDRERLQLVTRPERPTSPSSPNLKMNLALALMAGLILSAGLALALNAILRPVGDADSLAEELGVPLLAVVPPVRLGRADPTADPRGDDVGALAAPDDARALAAEPSRRPRVGS